MAEALECVAAERGVSVVEDLSSLSRVVGDVPIISKRRRRKINKEEEEEERRNKNRQ
jgi:hypothetical protein